MPLARLLAACTFALVTASASLGCGARPFDAGSTPDAGPALGDGGASFGDVGAPPPPSGPGCSADLHQVLDANGDVVETCPADQGCAAGACVPACQAAAAAKGAFGCDFELSTPAFTLGMLPPCFGAFVANAWGTDATVQISYGGKPLDATTFGRVPDGTPNASAWPALPSNGIAAGAVAVLFLSQDPSSSNPIGGPMVCPVTPAISQPSGTAIVDTSIPKEPFYVSGRGTTFHIQTSVPVSLYDISPFGGARSFLPSAELVMPTTAWGDNFVAVTPTKNMNGTGPEWLQVVASQDNTQVTLRPTKPLPAGTGVVAAPQGQATTYTLNAGEFLQWSYNDDLAGTVFSSTAPVAVATGTTLCLSSTTSPTGGGCDSTHQLMPPVGALGDEYVAAPYPTRRSSLLPESIPYRIVGAASGTTLVYDPPVSGAPVTLDAGQVADFESTTPFTVKSQDDQHVFYVTQMMPGCITTDGSRAGITPGIDTQLNLQECLGDEEFVDVLPPAQWLPKYVFFTDPTYATTSVAVTRRATATGFHDVTLDCLGTVTGWQPVGSDGEYETAAVDLIRATVPNGACKNGGHVATSDAPFGLTVWGVDEFASYAYPAGGNAATINTVTVPVAPK